MPIAVRPQLEIAVGLAPEKLQLKVNLMGNDGLNGQLIPSSNSLFTDSMSFIDTCLHKSSSILFMAVFNTLFEQKINYVILF